MTKDQQQGRAGGLGSTHPLSPGGWKLRPRCGRAGSLEDWLRKDPLQRVPQLHPWVPGGQMHPPISAPHGLWKPLSTRPCSRHRLRTSTNLGKAVPPREERAQTSWPRARALLKVAVP